MFQRLCVRFRPMALMAGVVLLVVALFDVTPTAHAASGDCTTSGATVGPDTLTGGAGADYFNGGSNTDTATDYTPSQGDTRDSIP